VERVIIPLSTSGQVCDRQRPAGEILPAAGLMQIFRPSRPFLSAVTVILANYRRRPRCILRVSLFILEGGTPVNSVTGPSSGTAWKFISESEEDGRAIFDNEQFSIFLPPQVIPADATLKLCLSSPDATVGNALTAWLHSGERRIPGHVQCRLGEEDFGELGLMAEVSYAPPLAETEIPAGLLISPVTQCNLNCTHCISRSTRKSLSRLDPGTRENILRWCKEGKVSGVATDYSGDILWADAHFGNELDFFLSLQVPFSIDTNGVCLSGPVIPRLLKSRLRAINVSLDAARPETYKRIRRGAPPLASVLANIGEFSTALTAANLRHDIRLSVSFALMTGNIDELPDFIRIASKLDVPAVFCRHLEVYTEEMESESLIFQPERFNLRRREAMEAAEQMGLTLIIPPEFDDTLDGNGRMPCLEPWRSAVILGNGDVTACCIPGTVIGNLHENTMEEIWQGERFQDFRRKVNSSDPPASCRACPIHRKRNNRLGYLPYRAKSL
jgi:radical SAM protein with 4Fe4S-binding SPASM domain